MAFTCNIVMRLFCQADFCEICPGLFYSPFCYQSKQGFSLELVSHRNFVRFIARYTFIMNVWCRYHVRIKILNHCIMPMSPILKKICISCQLTTNNSRYGMKTQIYLHNQLSVDQDQCSKRFDKIYYSLSISNRKT